tara:strand:+ start:866 stop:1192 length:327 start_codon:yes stop_codon:yes gene_type:complete
LGLLLALGVALSMLLAEPAWPAARCDSLDKLTRTLADKFGEHPVLAGLSRRVLLQMFVSRERTWTLVVVGPSGVACISAAGTDLETIPQPAPQPAPKPPPRRLRGGEQ